MPDRLISTGALPAASCSRKLHLAHNIDDSTNELFSSVVNPRRPFDWMNLSLDRGRFHARYPAQVCDVLDLRVAQTGDRNGLLKTLRAAGNGTGPIWSRPASPSLSSRMRTRMLMAMLQAIVAF